MNCPLRQIASIALLTASLSAHAALIAADNGLGDEGRALPKPAQALQPLADQGSTYAQNSLGYFYESGQGTAQDYQQAALWYRRAAEQGDAMAQTNLGALYEEGLGLPQDYQQAQTWYRLAAEQGHALAQVMLGSLYEAGNGVAADAAEAARWYRRAAEQNDPTGQYYLGTLYESGEGVSRDTVLAYALYTLAAEARHDNAERRVEFLNQHLSPHIVEQARALAAAWQVGAPLPEHAEAP